MFGCVREVRVCVCSDPVVVWRDPSVLSVLADLVLDS